MTATNPRSGTPLTATDCMKVILNSYMKPDCARLWVPDYLHDVEDFDRRFANFCELSIICAESKYDAVRGGRWFCAADGDTVHQHFGGVDFSVGLEKGIA